MLLDFSQKLEPLTPEETYQVLVNALDLRSGFGIFFLQCSPGEANRLIPRVRQDLPGRNIEVLDLVEPIDNLYRLLEDRDDRSSLNILFIRGLEKSLESDIKPGYKGLGDYYNLNTVPPILSHLNQQRENFRDHFPNICFVFVLPKFAIRYFVRRAPDFYDWNSGMFEIADQKAPEKFFSIKGGFDINKNSLASEVNVVSNVSFQTWYEKILVRFSKLWLNDSNMIQKFVAPNEDEIRCHPGNFLYNLGRYEEAIASYDRAIAIKPDLYRAWISRGVALGDLGRYEEEITSYEQAIAIKPDLYEAWTNRGVALSDLGRYEEAITSYERAITIKLDCYEAWNNRGYVLNDLGRYEDAITSCDQAIYIKSDGYESWNNRGNSLQKLGRYEEAITSYDKAIGVQSGEYKAWYNRGISLQNLGRYEEAITSYDRAIAIKPESHEAWHNKGYVLNNLGRYEEAITSYNRAISIKQDKDDAWHNKGLAYFKCGKYTESISCYDQAITIKPDKYDSWHDKGLVYFVTRDYSATLNSWQQAFNYISNLEVPRYYDVSQLIQEFMEELIPRFTQIPIHQTLLIPLLKIYKESNVVTELGAALVNTLHLIVAPTISDHTAAQWLALWRTSSLGHEPAMELPLRLMSTSIEYKKDPSKHQRLWLNLPSEERPILDKALKLSD
jgi:tetratricopeptide (TPR) repeat protein